MVNGQISHYSLAGDAMGSSAGRSMGENERGEGRIWLGYLVKNINKKHSSNEQYDPNFHVCEH